MANIGTHVETLNVPRPVRAPQVEPVPQRPQREETSVPDWLNPNREPQREREMVPVRRENSGGSR